MMLNKRPGATSSQAESATTRVHGRMEVPALESEIRTVRRWVRWFLTDQKCPESIVDDLELIASELATNVVMHTDSDDICVEISSSPREWTMDVYDASDVDLSDLTLPDPSEITGRGLLIVQALTDSIKVLSTGGAHFIRCTKSVT